MHRVLLFATRHPWPVLLFLGLVTLLAALQLPSLRLEITAEGMMVRGDPAREFYLEARNTFGTENVTVVYLEDSDLFEPEVLEAIGELVERIEALPEVFRTDSLFSVRNLRTQEGYTRTDPYFAEIPESVEKARQVASLALKNPLVRGNLLSRDLRAMAINIYLDPSRHDRGADERVAGHLEQLLAPLKARLEHVFFIGDPSVRSGLSERIREDQLFIVPLALGVLLLSLALMLRRVSAAFIPLATAVTSVVWTLGLMAWLGIPVNVMTSIVPALLIIIGSTEDIHLLAEYHARRGEGLSPRKGMKRMARNMGLAVTLTFLTTWMGFTSIAFNSLDLLRQFGLIASSGLLFNFAITVLLVPALIRLFPGSGKGGSEKPVTWPGRAVLAMTGSVLRHRRRSLWLIGVLALVMAAGIPRLQALPAMESEAKAGSPR